MSIPQLSRNLEDFVELSIDSLCHYCGDIASGYDHVRPLAWGGCDDRKNLVPACWPCNKRKANQPSEVWNLNHAERMRFLKNRGWTKRNNMWRHTIKHPLGLTQRSAILIECYGYMLPDLIMAHTNGRRLWWR